MRLIQYLWFCYQVYQQPENLGYFAIRWRGVPYLAVVIARDREAWRVSTFAVEALKRIR